MEEDSSHITSDCCLSDILLSPSVRRLKVATRVDGHEPDLGAIVLVGRPIAVNQTDKPTKEYLEQVQAQYIEELVRIWDTYKDTYARERTR